MELLSAGPSRPSPHGNGPIGQDNRESTDITTVNTIEGGDQFLTFPLAALPPQALMTAPHPATVFRAMLPSPVTVWGAATDASTGLLPLGATRPNVICADHQSANLYSFQAPDARRIGWTAASEVDRQRDLTLALQYRRTAPTLLDLALTLALRTERSYSPGTTQGGTSHGRTVLRGNAAIVAALLDVLPAPQRARAATVLALAAPTVYALGLDPLVDSAIWVEHPA
jgi:hypothetical protein